jgi:phenylacetate-CoA ligase
MHALKRATAVTRIKKALVFAVWPEIRAYLRDLESSEDAPAEQVVSLQLQKLNSLLRHFRGIDPVFRDLSERGVSKWQLSSLGDLKQFPIITKDMLRSYEANLGGSPYVARKGSTSGSTGRNFIFFQSRSMVRARSAAVRYCYERIGIDYWNDSRVVIWGRSPLSTLRTRLSHAAKQRFLNCRTLTAFGLDDRMCRSYLGTIADVQPSLVEGYPSYLAALAEVGLANGTGVRSYTPRAVVTSGEQMNDFQRASIEGWFRAPVFNRYGSREFGVIAHERPGLKGLWVPPTRFVIEEDAEGELLITDLDNYAYPFIRYAIGDLGTLASEFAGIQLIAELSGRTHDLIRTPSGRVLPGQFWTLLARSVPGIDEFQVAQTSTDRVELRVVATGLFTASGESELLEHFRRLAGTEMRLVVRRVPEITPTATGKRRFVIGLNG